MKIVTTDNKYIQDRYVHDDRVTNYEEKIQHMVDNGYGSIQIEDKMVSYDSEYEVDGERFVVVHVGSLNDG